MKCDVSSVLKITGEKIPVDFSFSDFEDLNSEFEYIKVHVCGEIVNIGDVLEFTAKAYTSFKTICARCTRPVEDSICVDISEVLKNVGDNDVSDDEDVVIFSGHTVDLGDIIRNNILLNMSTKYLCREDCKGLCPECGVDLNESQCDCGKDYIDPRMEGLKKLLEERQEV